MSETRAGVLDMEAEQLSENKSFKERLDPEDLAWSLDHVARYRFSMQWAPGARVLDVCCGIGYGSFILAASGARHVQGVDISDEAIGRANEQPALPNLRFSISDACTALPEPGTWELVTCFEGIEHVPAPEKLIDQIHAALKPGGIAVVSTPNADAFGGHSGNPFHLSEMTEGQFIALVGGKDWTVSWFAQIDNVDIWNRPAWQKPLLRTLRKLTRRDQRPGRSHSKLTDGISPAGKTASIDDWYPIQWERALSLMYQPPPELIIAVCRKGHDK